MRMIFLVLPTGASSSQLWQILTNPGCFRFEKINDDYFAVLDRNTQNYKTDTHLFLIHQTYALEKKIRTQLYFLAKANPSELNVNQSTSVINEILWIIHFTTVFPLYMFLYTVYGKRVTRCFSVVPVCHLWDDEMLPVPVVWNESRDVSELLKTSDTNPFKKCQAAASLTWSSATEVKC